MKSCIKPIGPVTFPEHTGERVYMLPFTKRDGLPLELLHWQLTIDAMLQGVDTDGVIYLMIDQGEVKAGNTHRRGGPHIDGNWIVEAGRHGKGGGRHNIRNGKWGGWNSGDLKPEGIILASDVAACAAWDGEIEGEPAEGGDCSQLDLTAAKRILIPSHLAVAGNVTMVHESLPIDHDCKRTVVRLNVPNWEPS